MNTDRLLLGQNANNEFGFWVSSPGVNVMATSFDPFGWQEDFGESGITTSDLAGWQGVDPGPGGKPVLGVSDSVHLTYKQQGTGNFLYGPDF